ncbi:MAG TPA: hypothetical protein VJX16_17565 [Terriglobales bacterium]|nr:hypothetical protein [Terriglobales bacterium]
MSKYWLAVLALIASLAFITPAAVAGHGEGKGKHHGNQHFDDDHGRWEARDGYEYGTYRDRDGRPPGWSRGKKAGWGNCGLPPGQAKKYGCRMYTYEGRPHYYYQDEHGQIFVRRPILEVHGRVDIVR